MSSAPLHARVRDAVERALAHLAACQLPSGAINDLIPDPLAALADPRPSRRLAFRLQGGADIWHTTNALLAFAAAGTRNLAAERFVRRHMSRRGELSYWSAHPSLCIETCSAAWQALPSERKRLAATIARHALPGGRWPNFLLPAPGGYDAYATGPSVSAWALGALGRSHPLASHARAYLQQTIGADGLWSAHPAFYATPYYPAHLAIAHLGEQRRGVVRATLRQQTRSGGWSFRGASARPSPLPTAFAVRTLVAGGASSMAAGRRALARAARWLLAAQAPNGAFPLAPAPSVLFYAGEVYATCVAVTALKSAEEVLA